MTDLTERLDQVEAELRASIDHQARVDYYMKLVYRVVCDHDLGSYVVSHPELPGCMAAGHALEEALSGLHEAKARWIEGRLEKGMSIPEPK